MIRCDGRDGRASAALVRDPIQGIFGGVLAIAAQIAFVLQRAPAAVRILGTQTVQAGLVHRAFLHFHLGHGFLRHHVQVHQLRVEQQIRVHGGAWIDLQISVFQGQGRALHHDLRKKETNNSPLEPMFSIAQRSIHGRDIRSKLDNLAYHLFFFYPFSRIIAKVEQLVFALRRI